MPTTNMLIDVPPEVEATAAFGMTLNHSRRVGKNVAERLTSGAVSPNVIAAMRRFFDANHQRVLWERSLHRNEIDSPTLRTWARYGGDAGKQWVDSIFPDLLREGLVAKDPEGELYGLKPDEIYDRFSLGAWRYEYRMNPSRAAKFVENYTRVTGRQLDLPRAFGRAANAVSNALLRRTLSPADLASVSLSESVKPQMFVSAPMLTLLKVAWPTLFAFLGLVTYGRNLIEKTVLKTKRPPPMTGDPVSLGQYSDAANTTICFFHMDGTHYVDPATTSLSDEVGDVDNNLLTLVRDAWLKKILATDVREILKRLEPWVDYNKWHLVLYKQMQTAWKNKDWNKILEHLPLESDLREPLTTLAFGAGDAESESPPAPAVDTGDTPVAPSSLGLHFGVGDTLVQKYSGKSAKFLGAFTATKDGFYVDDSSLKAGDEYLLFQDASGALLKVGVAGTNNAVALGNLEAEKGGGEFLPVIAPPDSPAAKWVTDSFDGETFSPNTTGTATSKAVEAKSGNSGVPGTVFNYDGSLLMLVGSSSGEDGKSVLLVGADGEFTLADDKETAAAVKSGEYEVVHVPSKANGGAMHPEAMGFLPQPGVKELASGELVVRTIINLPGDSGSYVVSGVSADFAVIQRLSIDAVMDEDTVELSEIDLPATVKVVTVLETWEEAAFHLEASAKWEIVQPPLWADVQKFYMVAGLKHAYLCTVRNTANGQHYAMVYRTDTKEHKGIVCTFLTAEYVGLGATAASASPLPVATVYSPPPTPPKPTPPISQAGKSPQIHAKLAAWNGGSFDIPNAPSNTVGAELVELVSGDVDNSAVKQPPYVPTGMGEVRVVVGIRVWVGDGVPNRLMLAAPTGAFSGVDLTLPGGHVEKGESLVKALRREVAEEVGVHITNIKYVGDVQAAKGTIRVYIASTLSKATVDGKEIDAVYYAEIVEDWKSAKWYKLIKGWRKPAVDMVMGAILDASAIPVPEDDWWDGNAVVGVADTGEPVALPKPKVKGDKAKVAVVPPTDFSAMEDFVNAPPDFVEFTEVAKLGGSNPVAKYEHNGKNWVIKLSKDGNPVRNYAEVAAYRLFKLAGLDKIVTAIPAGTIKVNGQDGAITPFVEHSAVPATGKLTDAQLGQVLVAHVFDMWVNDHDGNASNYGKLKSGAVFRIDHGQALKDLTPGMYLDPNHQGAAVGTAVGKAVLNGWSAGSLTLSPHVLSLMKLAVEKIAALKESEIAAALASTKYPQASSYGDAETIAEVLAARSKSMLDEWTAQMKKLRGDFAWPDSVPVLGETESAKAILADTDVAKELAQVKTAGWRGRSMTFDKIYVENMDVRVVECDYDDPKGTEQTGTLFFFRLSVPGHTIADPKLLSQVSGGDAATDGSLSIDVYYQPLASAMRTINRHLYGIGGSASEHDGKPNQSKVDKAAELLKEMTTLYGSLSDTGTYKGYDNSVVKQMLNVYIQWAEQIVTSAKGTKGAGDPVPNLPQFVYVAPAAAPSNVAISVKLTKNVMPSLQTIEGTKGVPPRLKMLPGITPTKDVFGGPQFHIVSSAFPGLDIYVKRSASSLANRGDVFGKFPGAATPERMSKALNIFEQAAGIAMPPASAADKEILYLSKQAYLLQGKITGDSGTGTGVSAPEYASALAMYEAGDVAGAKAAMTSFVKSRINKETGLTGDITDMPGYGEIAVFDGGGPLIIPRLGWTRETLLDTFKSVGTSKKTPYIVHHITSGSDMDIAKILIRNGALVPNARRDYMNLAHGEGGGSPEADMQTGGGNVIYTVLRRGIMSQTPTLHFDISLLLRSDVYIRVTHGDGCGALSSTRSLSIKTIASVTAGYTSGHIGLSSGDQIVVPQLLDLRQYLVAAVVANPQAVKQAIRSKLGEVTFFDGGTLDQVIVAPK